jgi:phenylacetic acid degradation operon negative regulatory protein
MELKRYRWTPASVDVPFLLGAIGARVLTGPALVTLLGGLGRGESAVRNLLTRMRELKVLDVETQGRTNVYRLAGSSMSRYREVEGTSAPPVWTGSFAALVHQVPESQRTLRDRLLHQAHNAGYGQLRAGVLIAPSDRWHRLRMDESEFSGEAWIHRTTITPRSLEQAVAMSRTAWNLPELERAYARALARCADVPAAVEPSWALLVFWREVYDVFFAAQLQDPHLPAPLLPADWPADRFTAAQAEVNARIGNALQPWLRERADAADPLGANDYYASPWAA